MQAPLLMMLESDWKILIMEQSLIALALIMAELEFI